MASTVAAAVAACPAVAGLHDGPVGSYLPGRRVPGVRLDADSARIVVDLAYPATVHDLETQVRAALGSLLDVPVDIEVADVILPGETDLPVDHNPAAPRSDVTGPAGTTDPAASTVDLTVPPLIPATTGDTA